MAGIPCSSQKKRSESCFLVEKNCISKAFILVDFFLFPQLLSWLKKIVFPHTCLWHISDKWSPNQYKRHQLFKKPQKVKTHAKGVLRGHKKSTSPEKENFM